MPLLEDKPTVNGQHGAIQHFDQLLVELLGRYTDDQKKIVQLTEENKTLKALLQQAKSHVNVFEKTGKDVKNILTSDNSAELMQKINAYIKEIDLCLAYFEQV
ncbi:hypothetical protein [Cardinium endosymbiont of Culicoides punctatus]|uniref:hypothetical protein n=1 Tax=Cardinium endosymbiont of Culicoides punctatus TaxID=2304601 RepID=UPI001058881B|nr:hypothetical protein [Cardinium endosymbiont of Culicoides punctatus]TDG95711.1 hypothetical protein CCPUN_01740 [Cardinium endosymbiont of Culicoides punctatus]